MSLSTLDVQRLYVYICMYLFDLSKDFRKYRFDLISDVLKPLSDSVVGEAGVHGKNHHPWTSNR